MTKLALHSSKAPRRTLVAILVSGIVAGLIGAATPSHLASSSSEFYSNGTQSYQTKKQIEAAAGPNAFPNLEVIFPVKTTRGPNVLATVKAVARTVSHIFYSTNGSSAALLGTLPSNEAVGPAASHLAQQFHAFPAITVGGSALIHQQFIEQITRDLSAAELIAFPLLFILAIVVFRSAVAALLPLAVGALVLGYTLCGLAIINSLYPLSILSLDVVAGLSLGLSLDYSLLMVSRYREELFRGSSPEIAILRTIATAGRTVAISSLTVATAFAAPLVFPIGVLRSLAIGGMLAALLAGLVSLLTLPAAFSLLGKHVNALSPIRWRRSPDQELAVSGQGAWYRLAQYVSAHPAPIAMLATVVLLAISAPALGIRLTGLDALSLLPGNASAHRFDERIRDEFPEPLLDEIVVAAHGSSAYMTEIATDFLQYLPNIASGEIYHVSGELWAFALKERESPFSQASKHLVQQIRSSPYGLTVTGSTADYIDTAASLRSRLPLALVALLTTTFLLLFAATRSVILPLKTIVMTMLSFTASLGMLVLLFQDGRLEHLLAYRSLGAIVVTQPVLLGAGIFGISTDYGIFMLTRIREEWESGLSSREAVAIGLERTGRIITAVALLFCVAVGAFVTARTTFVKEAALGMAFAVAIDATIVRSLLVPSLMTLLGKWNWWYPHLRQWLRRRVLTE